MRLSKLDYLALVIGAISFASGVVFVLIGYGLGAIVPGSGGSDEGPLLAPLAFILALPCAWLGLYGTLRYLLKSKR